MLSRTVLAALLLLSLSFSIGLVAPQKAEIQSGDVVDLGTIGPGQTVSILIDPKVSTGGIHGIGGIYDQAIAKNLPDGWASQESKLYQDPLQVTITASPKAPEGNYTATVIVMDEKNGEGLGNVTFRVKVKITYDVMDFDVSPSELATGPGQPAKFEITVTNKASTSDVFEISSSGTKKWDFKKQVFVPAQSSRTIPYEIAGEEELTYRATINVVSKASGLIHDEKNVTLAVRSDLFGDYRATNHGVLLFPIFEAPVYAFAGLLSNLFGG